MTSALRGLICGRSKVEPFSIMSSSQMTKPKLMRSQKKWKDLSLVEGSKKKEEDDAKAAADKKEDAEADKD